MNRPGRAARRLPILMFHAIDAGAGPLAFPPRLLRALLGDLAAHGWAGLGLSAGLARLDPGASPAGKPGGAGATPAEGADDAAAVPLLALTFDDGFRSVYREAFPVLRELRMTATVFLTLPLEPFGPAREGSAPRGRLPAFMGREMLSWDEIREMSAAGFEFGCHTRTHPDLTRLPPEEQRGEIAAGKEAIARATGREPTSFAYPFGRWNASARDHAALHYACACTDRLALADPCGDRFTLPRIDACYLRPPAGARLLRSRALASYLRLRNGPRTIRRMIRPPWNGERPCASA